MIKNKSVESKFFVFNKKAQMNEFMKIALWILFFALASVGAYYLVKSLTSV